MLEFLGALALMHGEHPGNPAATCLGKYPELARATARASNVALELQLFNPVGKDTNGHPRLFTPPRLNACLWLSSVKPGVRFGVSETPALKALTPLLFAALGKEHPDIETIKGYMGEKFFVSVVNVLRRDLKQRGIEKDICTGDSVSLFARNWILSGEAGPRFAARSPGLTRILSEFHVWIHAAMAKRNSCTRMLSAT